MSVRNRHIFSVSAVSYLEQCRSILDVRFAFDLIRNRKIRFRPHSCHSFSSHQTPTTRTIQPPSALQNTAAMSRWLLAKPPLSLYRVRCILESPLHQTCKPFVTNQTPSGALLPSHDYIQNVSC